MKVIEIKRKNGEVFQCFIDDEDFEKVKRYKWHIKKIGNIIYAHTWIIPKKGILMHKLILSSSNKMVDHTDGNGLNNQKFNLRYCNKSQNAANTNKTRGSSKYKGVTIAKSHGITYNSWYANIWNNNKRYFIGQFKSETEAALAYNKKAVEFFGEFANLNKL
jgi:hypothetical protein